MGRFTIVSSPISVSKKSARCEIWYGTCSVPFSEPTFPAPQKICRDTRKGIKRSAIV